MQLEFFIPLVRFLNILRLWGRRKVHSPPTPSPMHYNSFFFFNLLLPSQILPPSLPCLPAQSTLSGKQSLSSHGPQRTLHREPPHTDLALFLVSLVLCSSWCSFSRWGVGDRIAMGFWGPLTVFCLFVCFVFFRFHL